MAAMVDNGRLEYLRFRTSLKEAAEDGTLVEVTYRPEAGFKSDNKPAEEIYGLAQAAIEDVYGVRIMNLCNYAEDKPSRERRQKIC